MCGICGILSPTLRREEDLAIVRTMVRRLRHRGPDGQGIWADDHAVLGHARLAIIDLGGGAQPMFDATGRVGVIFNGEIYNFKEIRRELRSAGHVFRTGSDTEVLLHGYERWSDGLVSRLRGMFAFALWDSNRRRLLLARDRYGEKPLYYYTRPADGALVFASEIKALFADPAVPREFDERRLGEYLAFRSIAGNSTLFRDVRELGPGTTMVMERDQLQVSQYWSPAVPVTSGTSQATEIESGRRLLVDATGCRLVSDVRVGTITSGGVDSSLVSAIACDVAASPLDTFCVGFADSKYDERQYARRVAEHIGSRHHEIEVSGDDIDSEFDRLTWAHDEPLTHPNSVPMHLIFREAKEQAGVTVVLSGEGADEVFGGYEWYAVARRRQALLRLPGLAGLLSLAPGRRGAVLRKVLSSEYLLRASAITDPVAVARLIEAPQPYLGDRPGLWPSDASGSDGLFVYDQRTYLPPLLQRQDRMSMAAGVEARVIFLDHQLAEWANALPAVDKLAGGERKALLKAMARRWLPESVIRRRKVGFTLPLAHWIRRDGPLAGRLDRLRERECFVRGLVDRRELDRLLGEHDRVEADHSDLLWSLMALEQWAVTFLGPTVQEELLPGARQVAATGVMETVG